MKYLFGPVNSRRLGISQGVDLLPGYCTYNCIYCEINCKKIQTSQRQEYTPTADIIREIDTLLTANNQGPDVYTITASGEPTLHSGIGKIIRHIKARSQKPVIVLTNGSLLPIPEVRKDLMAADIVVPSLDAARDESFRRINRPLPELNLTEIVTGIQHFKHEFPGELWLEILLARGINDQDNDIKALKKAIALIAPHKTQLNTVDRPPFEEFAHPLDHKELKKIADRLDGEVEIIASCPQRPTTDQQIVEESKLIELLRRRPCTTLDISQALHYDETQTAITMQQLANAKQITLEVHRAKKYWTIKE